MIQKEKLLICKKLVRRKKKSFWFFLNVVKRNSKEKLYILRPRRSRPKLVNCLFIKNVPWNLHNWAVKSKLHITFEPCNQFYLVCIHVLTWVKEVKNLPFRFIFENCIFMHKSSTIVIQIICENIENVFSSCHFLVLKEVTCMKIRYQLNAKRIW